MSHKNRITAALVTGTLLFTACGGESHNMSDMSTGSTNTDVTGSERGFNDADIMFAQMMIPHHEQALELADMALDPTLMASEQVKALASQIKAAQDPEIDVMTQWLSEWDQPLMDMSEDHSMTMEGMLSIDELSALGQMSGEEFDQAWVSAMIAHHKGAIKMADTVKAEGKSAPVQELADAIIQAQKSEIDTLELLLK
ncbi:MAG: hypothetical protein RIS69_574 [Actinomycetota bacterium]|jgi:uncharacterized protein (DUF305 family)